MKTDAKKEMSLYHLIVITVFVGLLLSFSIFYITNMLVDGDDKLAPACYDGSTFVGTDPAARFNRAVYQNEDSLSFVQEYQYRLFGIVNNDLVIAGRHGFLFEIEDDETGYHYIEDYTGNCRFSNTECAVILHTLEQRRDSYARRGAEYLLVILPNAQTVYSDCMPSYYGPISESTRLTLLEQYLTDHGFYHFTDLTEALIAAKDDGLLYNNTENSLNALGLYHTYLAVSDILANTDTLPREELIFYQHLTAGKGVARKAGLAHVVENRTVSLSNSTKLNYRFIYNEGAAATTIRLPFYVSSDVSGSPELLLQFSDTWERLQIEPFFSNTFSQVTYQTDLSDDPAVFEAAAPKVVIQFIYENELSLLLPH